MSNQFRLRNLKMRARIVLDAFTQKLQDLGLPMLCPSRLWRRIRKGVVSPEFWSTGNSSAVFQHRAVDWNSIHKPSAIGAGLSMRSQPTSRVTYTQITWKTIRRY